MGRLRERVQVTIRGVKNAAQSAIDLVRGVPQEPSVPPMGEISSWAASLDPNWPDEDHNQREGVAPKGRRRSGDGQFGLR
ncbi:MAG TPA: hypothetical protein VLB73_03520 [Patescibacteria group bacterium]|nr:hypothetical protein [Patescibacteria group bacterium]